MGKFNNIKQTPLVKPIGSDAFGRITVAQPQTLFDSKPTMTRWEHLREAFRP
jgi:hypothetical protein